MNMQKQKPIWSKILAMLCALALCISMVPAASAARPSTTSTVSKVTVDAEGISEFWTESGATEIGSPGETIDNIHYSFSNSSLVIETTDDTKLPKTITFFAVVNYQPTITSSNDGVSAIASDYGDDWWMITISLANATASEVTLNAEAVPTYTVTFDENGSQESKGYTLIKVSSDTVKHGESYQFYVIPKTGYQTPEVTVTSDGSALESVTLKDGLYTVANIQSDITITIGKAQPQKYTVNFIFGDGYSFESANDITIAADGKATVNYGGSVSFKVNLDNDYNKSDVTVYANGSELEVNEADVYTINNITMDQTVSVTGVEKNKYTVKLPENTDGYYITTVNPTVVEPGGQFTFNVVVNPGYESNHISVMANNTTVDKNENGSYTISNITTDTTISISGIEEAQYNVTTSGSNATVKVGETAIEDYYHASYGNLTFTITPDAGYKVDSVKVNDTSVTADSDGKYTIFVSNNVDIVVTTSPVVEITLTTTVTGAETLTITIKTEPSVDKGETDGITIVAFGTLYSNRSFTPGELEDEIATHLNQTTSTRYTTSNGTWVYNYYYGNQNIALTGLNGAFSYKFNSNTEYELGSRFGAGWIELQGADGRTWIVTTENSVALTK